VEGVESGQWWSWQRRTYSPIDYVMLVKRPPSVSAPAKLDRIADASLQAAAADSSASQLQ
jgi:hypothetical protein